MADPIDGRCRIPVLTRTCPRRGCSLLLQATEFPQWPVAGLFSWPEPRLITRNFTGSIGSLPHPVEKRGVEARHASREESRAGSEGISVRWGGFIAALTIAPFLMRRPSCLVPRKSGHKLSFRSPDPALPFSRLILEPERIALGTGPPDPEAVACVNRAGGEPSEETPDRFPSDKRSRRRFLLPGVSKVDPRFRYRPLLVDRCRRISW